MNPDTNNPAAFPSSGLPQAAPETDRNGSPLDKQAQEADTEELVYDFVPPKQTVTVSVRYRIRGRGQPLPYPLDEEDGQ
jgi:hypothetical protein